jgi:cobalt/nickel transport system permease protein
MKLAEIDYISNSNASLFHEMNAAAKMLFTAAVLTAVIISSEWTKLVFLIILMAILFIAAKIPMKVVLHLALYAIIFSSLFALISARQSLYLGLVVVLKALGAALSTIWLITTTSYVDIFSVFSLFMPKILVDVFIFTYRSFFILMEKMEMLFKNIRLRGGYHPLKLMMNLKNIASIVGIFIIHAFEMSERMYQIYSLRGYNGSIALSVELWPLKLRDISVAVFGVFILIGVIII